MSIFGNIFGRLFSNRNARIIKQLQKTIDQINRLEKEWQTLSNEALKAKTKEFKARLKNHESEASLLPEAFATVREASRRVLNMRHFDVQLMGGLALHQGKIAEMRTGEGKTLVATLPAYLNALSEKGVHVVTVNDYLAQRDAAWMEPLYQFLGLSVGVIKANLTPVERQVAYKADITYGTNNEFGFDYLRDNMALDASDTVQRSLHYALIDEVDSILIDESRTPLIISGPGEAGSDYYTLIDQLIPYLKQGESADFTVDEKKRQVHLTEKGHGRLEAQLQRVGLLKSGDNLYSPEHINLMYHASAALQAHHIYKKDIDYIVQANQIVIVDEHTGRLMSGRRWGEGLHQAIEAKERVKVQIENQTLARITYQNYFRLYNKLAGMTGTADTEAYEFQQIYGLEVVVVPTHRPTIRKDYADVIYKTPDEKWKAIVDAIQHCRQRHQPVLVGTASIQNSEHLSVLLQKKGIAHQVLNAKRHEQEAHIIAEAGRPSAVTIATNMAGRGTDIVLGGNLKAELAKLSHTASPALLEDLNNQWESRYKAVVAAGGLHIIGSERHESRRIDNQLRGRSGRQGDPGSSQFFLSLQDDLMRHFGGDRLDRWVSPGEMIEHPLITRAIQKAQHRVEAYHFDARKQLLEYDDVMNEQRKILYQQRQEILIAPDIREMITALQENVLREVISQYCPSRSTKESWKIENLSERLKDDFDLALPLADWVAEGHPLNDFIANILDTASKHYHDKEEQLGYDRLRQIEKSMVLQTIDHLWQEQLSLMEYLLKSIHFRGIAQKNPKQEYKREAFELFKQLLERLKYQVVTLLSRLDVNALSESSKENSDLQLSSEYQMIGRNSPCPCGSEKKFKHCHGRLE